MVGMPAGALFVDHPAVWLISAEDLFARATGKGPGIGTASIDGGLFDTGGDLMKQSEDMLSLFTQQNVRGCINFEEDCSVESVQQHAKSGRPGHVGRAAGRRTVILAARIPAKVC